MVEEDFSQTARQLASIGMYPDDKRVFLQIPDAEDVLRRGLRWKFGDNAKWLPEYQSIASWLTDNQGRGLLMFGQCGRGKTVMGRLLLPLILNGMYRKIVSCFTSQEMNKNPEEVLNAHIIYLDDIGIESQSVEFGNRRIIFPEVVDAAERKGKMLIISTNLSLSEIKDKYGIRTADRLKAITSQVPFIGESLRR